MKANTSCISMAFCLTLTLLTLSSMAQGQQKTAKKPPLPTTPKTPTVNCSEAQISKACGSFKQLLEAKDKDLLDSLSSPTSYVCFRPKEDAFLIFHVNAPRGLWEHQENRVETQTSLQVLGEFRNGVFYHDTTVFGHWSRLSFDKEIMEPMFTTTSNMDDNEKATVNIDAAEISIEYPFKNQNGGTTQYSLIIRRSTGRFIETYSVENTPSTTNTGTCLIYR